ncbi:hypothetical protein E2C01_079199 [Portunus trituberculatus]|uniref:Uncharacterized protein n=1 Tax=Portunus trituberculatus TaxID=210409 RepID=A0A5B7IGB9_PORTR|nr:hypothetical protein [Portunus trituberculatus]
MDTIKMLSGVDTLPPDFHFSANHHTKAPPRPTDSSSLNYLS